MELAPDALDDALPVAVAVADAAEWNEAVLPRGAVISPSVAARFEMAGPGKTYVESLSKTCRADSTSAGEHERESSGFSK